MITKVIPNTKSEKRFVVSHSNLVIPLYWYSYAPVCDVSGSKRVFGLPHLFPDTRKARFTYHCSQYIGMTKASIATPRSTMRHVFEYDPSYRSPRSSKNSVCKREDSVCSSTDDTMSESLGETSFDRSFCSVNTLIDQELRMDNNMDAPPKQSTMGSKRRVRFRVDKANCIISDKSSAGSTHLSGEEREAMWWSRKEIKKIQQDARSMCRLYLRSKKEFCREIALLLTLCARTDASECCLRTNQTVNAVAHGPARGIETLLVPMFARRQTQSIRAVLCAQDSGEAAHLLSVRYQHSSRYAGTWARVMADADAMCHLHHHQQDEELELPKL
jgi:hypothetical protein